MSVVSVITVTSWLLINGGAHSTSFFQTAEKRGIVTVGTMNSARFGHSSTLLPDGRVLIAGGQNGSALATAEIFEPGSKGLYKTGTMSAARSGHSATLLPDGKVLIAGGYNGSYLSTAELYDPATDSFSHTSPMTTARSAHEAVLLDNGKVLLVGGIGTGWSFLASAEIYDPQSRAFTETGDMTMARESHTATILTNGRVLITGGHRGRRSNITVYRSTEVYDPSTGEFVPGANMSVRRHKHDATLLSDGRVLIVGGSDERDRDGAYRSAEIFDPSTGMFTRAADMSLRRYKLRGTTILLPSGQVLVVGGANCAELYDPAVDGFTIVGGTMGRDRLFATATLLQDGTVLITGGYDETMATSSRVWLY